MIGISIAIVPSGPMPGSTPIRVPTSTPMRQYSRFCTDSATPKPNTRLPNRSMTSIRNPQTADKAGRAPRRTSRPKARLSATDNSRTSTNLNCGPASAEPKISTSSAGTKPAWLISTPNSTKRQRQDHHRPQRPPPRSVAPAMLRRRCAAAQAAHNQVETEQDQDPAEHRRKIAGSHAQRRAEGIVARDQHGRGASRDQHEPSPELSVLEQFALHCRARAEQPAPLRLDG